MSPAQQNSLSHAADAGKGVLSIFDSFFRVGNATRMFNPRPFIFKYPSNSWLVLEDERLENEEKKLSSSSSDVELLVEFSISTPKHSNFFFTYSTPLKTILN